VTTWGSLGHLEAIAARRDAEDEAWRKQRDELWERNRCVVCDGDTIVVWDTEAQEGRLVHVVEPRDHKPERR